MGCQFARIGLFHKNNSFAEAMRRVLQLPVPHVLRTAARAFLAGAFEDLTCKADLAHCSGFPRRAISQNGSWNLGQGENFLRSTAKYGFARHSENHAASFILCNRERIRLFHLEQTVRAVVTHPGHQNAYRNGPGGLRHGAEQHVDAGTVAGHQGTITHLEKITRTDSTDKQMAVSGGNVGSARHNLVAVSGLFYFDAANAIQPLGVSCSEALGHMLYCDNSRAILWHLFEYVEQGFRASGGRSDGHNLFSSLRACREGHMGNYHVGGVVFRGIATEHAKLVQLGFRGRPHGIFQQYSGLFEETANTDFRFGNEIHRTNLQRTDGFFGPWAGQTGTHHDGNWILRHELFEKRHAVHSRHFQVQENHIRRELFHFVHGDDGFGGHSDAESALFRKHGHPDLAYDR